MKQVSHRGYLLVEVPEDATPRKRDVTRFKKTISWIMYRYWNKELKKLTPRKLRLPPGQWEIIGKGNEINISQMSEIVGSKFDHLDDLYFKIYGSDKDEWTSNPDESFDSLIKSHGMKPERVLILRKT